MKKKTQNSFWVGGFAVRLVAGNPPVWQVACVQDRRFVDKKLPGGMSRLGESVKDTLTRELQEEFGIYPIDDPRIVYRKTTPDHTKLFCLILAYGGQINENPLDEVVPKWVPLSDIRENLFSEHVIPFTKCCIAMAKVDDCFSKVAKDLGLI